MSPERRESRSDERGFTVVEVILTAVLALIVAIAVYDFFDNTNRKFVRENDLAAAQNTGRAALDLFANDVRVAGYAPHGRPYVAVPSGTATKVQLLSDLDGDGAVGFAGEDDENVTYEFVGPNSRGTYVFQRGADLNGDGDFGDTGESSYTIAEDVVPIDFNKDGTNEPLIAYDIAPPVGTVAYDPAEPWTSRITITYGIQAEHLDLARRTYPVVRFQSDVYLRNR